MVTDQAARIAPLHTAQPLGAGWCSVVRGLSLIRWGAIVATIGSLPVALLTLVLWIVSSRPTLPDWPAWVNDYGEETGALAWVGISVAACLLLIFGHLSCCRVPAQGRLRALAQASACGLVVAALLLGLAEFAALLSTAADPAVAALGLCSLFGSVLAVLVSEVFFLWFLYDTGQVLRSRELSDAVRTFCVLFVAVALTAFFLGVLLWGWLLTMGVPGAGPGPLAGWDSEILSLIALLIVVFGGTITFAYLHLLGVAGEVLEDYLLVQEIG